MFQSFDMTCHLIIQYSSIAYRDCEGLAYHPKARLIFTLWHLYRQDWLGIAMPKNAFRSTINPSMNLIWNFKISYLAEFSTDWLTDWLMPSDERNLIMAIQLDLFTVQCCFIQRHAFLSTAAAPILASWFYQRLPLFSLCSIPFSLTTKVTICGTHVMASVQDLSKFRASRGISYAIFCLNCYPKGSQSVLEAKRSDTAV